jgi:hypothetical protein
VKKSDARDRVAVEAASPWGSRSKQLLAAAAVVLMVVATLIVSESAAPLGTHVVPIMAWLLVGAVTSVWLLAGLQRPCRIGMTETLVALFLLTHCVSALVMLHAGHARPTLNTLWLWVSFGMLFLSVRQLFSSPVEQRALVSAMIALATGLSVFGLYQVGYSNPQMRARYAEDPEAALRDAGIDAPPGSPQRQHYENRLASKEPIGPFALTNSLAGVLAPTFVLLLFIAGSYRGRSRRGWPDAVGLVPPALAMAACLLLTKSRSAYGAVLVGAILLALSHAVPRRWLRWPVVVGVGGVVLTIALVVGRLGGLDRQVITEAPKSLAYRFQYWQATGAMIADHPGFGCGPGNFQSFYTRYKLPEASEEIADPHCFLLEVAATAGLPALVLFLLIPAALAVDVRRRQRRAAGTAASALTDSARLPTAEVVPPGAIYAGVVAGFVLAYPAGWAGELPPDFGLLWIACPAAIATLWLLHSWVVRGQLPRGPLVVASIVLLVNLLAAGGIGFPGVGQFVWLLGALVLNASMADDPAPTPAGRGRVAGRVAALVIVAALVAACYLTMYRPVLGARQAVEAAREAKTQQAAQRALERAAGTDPWWGEPWEYRTELESRQWIASPTNEQLAAFYAARDALLARDHNSSRVYRRCGDWLLEMFAASGRADIGTEAVRAYEKAVELYPASGILHAQLAWACHVTGHDELSRQHADEALRLDALMPHREYKLACQRLVGDYLAEWNPPAGAEHAPEYAEQLMQRVRNVKNH